MFLSISVSDKSGAPFALSVPISWGEIEVLKVLVTYCIPRFLAVDRFFDTASTDASNGTGTSTASYGQQGNLAYGQQSSKPSPYVQFSNQQPYSYNN